MNYTELCERITNEIVASLEAGDTGTWSAPWHRMGPSWAPRNASTGSFYGGGNVIALATVALDSGWSSPWWATYKQWSGLDAQVRKGEKSTTIVKWVPTSKKKNDDKPPPTTPDGTPMQTFGPRFVPKTYGVFNLSQTNGWEPPATPDANNHTPIDAAETWIEATAASISYGFDHACYMPALDRIEVPDINQYPDPVDHYATVCHELIHWTGNTNRLKRDLTGRFGDDAYAAEELVAELGAAFTCARLGLTNKPRIDHTQYLAHWLRILKADPKALFAAASQAQKAVTHIEELNTDHHEHDEAKPDQTAGERASVTA